MRTPFMFRCVSGTFMVLTACVLSSNAYAEMDFEYAQKLLTAGEDGSFPTDDLLERLITKLEANPTLLMESKLIKATLKRKTAKKAGAEKRTLLLDESAVLYKEILAGDKNYRHYAEAVKDSESIIMDRIGATMAAAKEFETSNPEKSHQMKADAAAQVDKIAEPYKAAAAALEPEFKTKLAAFTKEGEKTNPTTGEPIPVSRAVEDALIKSFNAWYAQDQKYIATKVVAIECYDDSNPAKKTNATEMTKYIDLRLAAEGYPPETTAWYSFMAGRVCAAVQSEKASEYWEPLLRVEGAINETQKKLMRLVIHDYVKMKMKAKKYDEVVSVISEGFLNAILRSLFDEQAGKELIIDYVMALTIPVQDASGVGEYEKAIKKLREMIEKETKDASETAWSNTFARTMADILESARAKNIKMRLKPEEWYDAAHGFYLMGQHDYKTYTDFKDNKEVKDAPAKAKEAYEDAYAAYQNAVDYYRRAISKARAVDTDLTLRFKIEPKAWSEMGLAYIKMGNFYEAVIAYQSLRKTFLPDYRKKWMPDPVKQAKLYTPELKALLKKLDAKTGLLAKSGSNMIYALDQNAQKHKDTWNRALKDKLLNEGGGNPEPDSSRVKDKDYLTAKGLLDEAKSLVDEAKTLTDPKPAEENYTTASKKYIEAAELFTKIPTTSDAYEFALYQTGSTYTMVHSLWAAYRFPSQKPKNKDDKNPQEVKSAELAKKALAAFDKYMAYVAAHTPAADAVLDEKGKEDKERREKLEGGVLLARPTLLMAVALVCTPETAQQDWSAVIKGVDDYIAYEQRTTPQRSAMDTVLLNKFHALIKLGAINFAPKCDPYLADAEKIMKELRKLKPTDNKLYGYMLDSLSTRYNIASFQALQFIKENKMAEGAERPYEDKVAELQAIRVDMKAEVKDGEQPTLEDLSRLVYLFRRSNMTKRAADMALKLLKTFDPENKNMKLPDDEKYWRGVLANMIGDADANKKGIISYERDHVKEDRCKADHMLLIDYMYDTAQGRNAATPEARPKWDKKNYDLSRAQDQLDTIIKNYPDVQTLLPMTINGVAQPPYLKMIGDEIDFRRKIDATRDVLSDLSQKVADAEEVAGNADEAKKYRIVAADQVGILMESRGPTDQMKIKQADLLIATGKYEDALNALFEVKNKSERETTNYFDASKKIAEVYRKQGKWVDASIFPKFLDLARNAKMTRDRWPDLADFLEDCYKHGVNRPDLIDSTEPKKEDKKTDKPDSDKKETPAPTEAPKAP